MKPNPIEVGQRIKSIRIQKGLTMKEFGELVGDPITSESIVSRWEKGKSLPNNKRLKIISVAGEISTDELLYGKSKDYEQKWNNLKKEISEIAPGSIDQSLAFNQVLEIMNKLEEEV